jgi:hypothetical protein
MRAAVLLAVLSMLLLSTVAVADVPGLMSYQGTLTDGGGVALDTTLAMTFTIYYDSTGGASIWTETQPSVVITDGIFNVLLGSVNPLSEALFGGSPSRWLGVQMGGDPELTPRQRIATVAHAFHAAEAETASYALSAPATSDGDWVISGSDMYAGVSGNVGIGTSTPAFNLDIQDSYPFVRIKGSAGNTGLVIDKLGASDFGHIVYRTGGADRWAAGLIGDSNYRIRYWPTSTDVIYLHSSGDVGIGTTSPEAKLDCPGPVRIGSPVFSPSSTVSLALCANDSTSATIPLAIVNTNMDYLMYVRGNGDVGLGTFLPSAKLDVVGTAKMTGFTMPTGAASGHVLTADASGNGTWQAGFTGLWTDAVSHIYPNDADNFKLYDNSASYIGLSYVGETETEAVTNWSNDGSSVKHCWSYGSNLYGLNTSASSALTDYGVLSHGEEYGGYFSSDGIAVYGSHSGGNYGHLGSGAYGTYGYSSSGFGVYGSSTSGNGLRGYSVSGKGVYAYSSSNIAVHGVSVDSFGVYGSGSGGNYGYLGSDTRGAYGRSSSGTGVSGTSSSGIGVFASSVSDVGVVGQQSNSGNWGSLGSSTEGAYGYSSSGNAVYGYTSSGYGIRGHSVSGTGVYGSHGNSNYGYIGSASYGAYGRNNNGNYGYLGSSSYGMRGYSGQSASGTVGAYGYHGNSAAGTDYLYSSTKCGVLGYAAYGTDYHCGVQGVTYSNHTGNRCSGVHGHFTDQTGFWGSLAYKTSTNAKYGGYFTSYTTGAGKGLLESEAQTAVGLGSWGDLFGADIHGKVYGAYVEGGNYALYSKGDVFTNGIDVHLQETETPSMAVLYTNVSTDVTVQTSGFATLSGGKSTISFDEHFRSVVSPEVPVVVTVTPTGPCEGIYVSGVTKDGFTVVENGAGKSEITVAFIAIGRRAGYEDPQLPAEVISSDYVDKLSRGLHNDADTETDGEGLYYQNGQLYVGMHSSVLPVPHERLEDLDELEDVEERRPEQLEALEREKLERERIEEEARMMAEADRTRPEAFEQERVESERMEQEARRVEEEERERREAERRSESERRAADRRKRLGETGNSSVNRN